MFALRIEYLTGRCIAADHTNRETAEWPPHPFRVFSAFVAAMKNTRETAEMRFGLEWLERQNPPFLRVSDADHREVTTFYVPVNDATLPTGQVSEKSLKKVMGILPEYRNRQPRTFPSVTPMDSEVYMIWPESNPPESIRRSLDSLCSRVTYIGHSSSLVAVQATSTAPSPNLIPDEAGGVILRVPFSGQLAALEAAYETHQGFLQRTLPSGYARYRRQGDLEINKPIPGSGFGDDWVVFRRVSGASLPIKSILGLTSIFRRAAISGCQEPVPEALSGHDSSGAPSTRPHVAFTALPDVYQPFGKGGILGIAAILPRDMESGERKRVLRAFGGKKINHLTLGDAGIWEIERLDIDSPLKGLQPWTWCRASRYWATVSPVVLDRFPKKDFEYEGRSIIAEACLRVGLPEPEIIRLSAYSPIRGVPPAWAFPAKRTKPGKPRRWHTHVEIVFKEPVRGPVLVGAGRYQGYGLFRPRREQ